MAFLIRIILIGLIIVAIILFFRSLRRAKERETKKIDRCIEILGLHPGATKEEVNQAYKDMVNVWHPDRFANNFRLQKKAEAKLKEINAAYEYIRSFYRWK